MATEVPSPAAWRPAVTAGRPALADLALWLTHLAWLIALAWHHEPWRDELQGWGIARASGDPAALLANLRYEGHPPLWYLPVWALSRVTADPAAQTWLVVALAAVTAALVLRHAPFPRPVKALVLFSYPLGFEFAVMARSYGLGLLLVVGCLALWPTRHRHAWALGGLLGLLALTSGYGFVLAAAFAATLAVEAWRTRAWRAAFAASPDQVGLGAGLAAAGLALTAWLVRPPADFVAGAGLQDFPLLVALPATGVRLGWGLFPLPGQWEFPWSSAWLSGLPAILAGLAGVALVYALGPRGRPLATAFFAAALLGLVAFGVFMHLGVLRHALHFSVAAWAALWLAAYEGPPPAYARGWGRWALAALLAPSVVATAVVGGSDLARPFSNARAMARYLGDAPPPVAANDYATCGVGILRGQPLYLLEARAVRPFVVWNRARFMDDAARYAPVREVMGRGKVVALLVNHELTPPEEALLGGRATLVHAETGAIVPDEDFYLYAVAPARP